MPVSVFYSYSHRDQDLRDELEKHLSTLQRTGTMTRGHDRRIEPGENWRGKIDPHLRSAQVVLLLISDDFLDSDYCYGVEMKLALKRHTDKQAVVVPIMLRPVDWAAAPFTHLPVLPSDGRPVTSSPDRDQVFGEIAVAVRDLAQRRQTAPAQSDAGSPDQLLHSGVQQRGVLTPSLVKMVTVLQLNRMELKNMIINEIAENPVLEEAAEGGEEVTPAELQLISEPEADQAQQAIREEIEQP